jgi:hypothetical protein
MKYLPPRTPRCSDKPAAIAAATTTTYWDQLLLSGADATTACHNPMVPRWRRLEQQDRLRRSSPEASSPEEDGRPRPRADSDDREGASLGERASDLGGSVLAEALLAPFLM